jgi:hypothetical protein
MTRETINKAPESRVKRTPINARNVLTLSDMDPGYSYRFVNDTGDRVQAFLDNGWEKVPAKTVRVGDKRLGSPSTEGTDATASVGQGMKAYVLRIRKDWYEDDQAAKQAKVNATEEATRQQALDGTYGKLEVTRS